MHDSDHTRQTTTGIKTLDSNNSDPSHPSITQPPCSGGASRDRTDDIQLAKLALSQLSYGPAFLPALLVVGLTRLELVTPRLSSVCSNQLSYRPASGQRHRLRGKLADSD
jgi:hypothetical protein